jgi:hypothetical protein
MDQWNAAWDVVRNDKAASDKSIELYRDDPITHAIAANLAQWKREIERNSEIRTEALKEAADRVDKALSIMIPHGDRPFDIMSDAEWYITQAKAVSLPAILAGEGKS